MSSPLDRYFEARSTDSVPFRAAPCPSDDALAAWIEGLLPLAERRPVDDHLLACEACHEVVGFVLDGRMVTASEPAPSPLSLVVQVMGQGLQLLGETAQRLLGGEPQPALGGVRGDAAAAQPVRLAGPGGGLDELELLADVDGRVRVQVHGQLELLADESASLLLEADGEARERRRFGGGSLALQPLSPGDYTLRLVARTPGKAPRTLSETRLQLRA